MYQIYRNWTKEDHPQIPSKRKDLWKGERWLVKILCTATATPMSPWWGCGLWQLFHESSFSSFLKYTKLSAAQSNILAMLITSCSQTDHRHSGLHNKIIQMLSRESQNLCVLILFFHITGGNRKNALLWLLWYFWNYDWEKKQNTSGKSANLKRHRISGYVV